MILKERQKRLEAIFSHHDVVQDFPLVKGIRLEPGLLAPLEHAVIGYLLSSLRHSYPGKAFEWKKGFLEEHRSEILGLVNRTPNGVLAVKTEILREMSDVQDAVGKVFKSLAIDSETELLQMPVTVRVQDGEPNRSVDGRPYATSKIHADVWTGEPTFCVPIIIPVLGDLEKSGLEFYETPVGDVKKFARVFDDYLDTEEFVRAAKKYDCVLKPGHLYVFDAFCLHKSVKNGPGVRISVDFRFTCKKRLPSDVDFESFRLDKYLPIREWYNPLLVRADQSFEEARRQYMGSTK